MLTVPEAARRANRDPETVRRWIRAGKLPARKVGTQHVIDEDDLAATISEVSAREPAGRAHRLREVAMPYRSGIAASSEAGIDPWLTTIVGRIVRLCDPVRIMLFGSRARGDARDDSDYDLLVILDDVTDRRAMRLEVRRVLDDLPISKDVVVVPVEDVDGRNGTPWGVLGWALREGRTLYDRQ
jgi:excisionase family DNA binding protein